MFMITSPSLMSKITKLCANYPQNESQGRHKIDKKSIKSGSGSKGVPIGVPKCPWVIKTDAQASKMEPPAEGAKMEPTASQNHVFLYKI